MNYGQKYAEYKKLTEEALELPELKDSKLYEPMIHSLKAGGKRIRPVLTLAFCEAFGGDIKKALPVAAAIEILHTSTLIQDDLPCMDDDDLRRGQPSCHKAFSEADAVLSASLMAYHAIGLTEDPEIIKWLCRFMAEVYEGQKLDLSYAEREDLGVSEILEVYALKTCALLQAACLAGCLTAKSGEVAVEKAVEYAYNLGLAFQITDDILDETSDPETLGKPVKSDSKNQKRTYVTAVGQKQAKKDSATYTEKALEVLKDIPNNEFLTELTKKMSDRKN